MIDIHCHILPDIDDGPQTFDESLEMARIAADDGIRVIVATPHVNEVLYDTVEVSRRASWLKHLLRLEKVGVQLATGGDVSTIFCSDQVKGFTINHTDYILVEFPHSHLPINAAEILFNYLINGLNPIITHPERNPSIARDPRLLFDLLQDGVYVQITAGSIVGEFGQDARLCAVELLRVGVVDVIATDAHSSTWRRPILSKGVRAAARIVGEEKAHQMVQGTPEKILAGLPL